MIQSNSKKNTEKLQLSGNIDTSIVSNHTPEFEKSTLIEAIDIFPEDWDLIPLVEKRPLGNNWKKRQRAERSKLKIAIRKGANFSYSYETS